MDVPYISWIRFYLYVVIWDSTIGSQGDGEVIIKEDVSRNSVTSKCHARSLRTIERRQIAMAKLYPRGYLRGRNPEQMTRFAGRGRGQARTAKNDLTAPGVSYLVLSGWVFSNNT